MKLIPRLAALAVATAVALAATAGLASAAIEFRLEKTGAHCGAVTFVGHGTSSTGCLIHARNVGSIEVGTPVGMITCTSHEFTSRVSESGIGFISGITISGCSSSVVECSESGVDDNWPLQLNSESTAEMAFCVTAFGFLNVNCTIEFLQITDNASHSGDLITTGVNHVGCDEGGGNSLFGVWSIENSEANPSEPEVELVD